MPQIRAALALLCVLLASAAPGQVADEAAASEAGRLPAPSPDQWGAITLFHGLPSNQVLAIGQDREGTLWFGTDAGLARFDGLRVQKVVADGLPAGPVRVLATDEQGALWIGTDDGAVRVQDGRYERLAATHGHSIRAILAVPGKPVVLASAQGALFEWRADAELSVTGPREQRLLRRADGTPLPLVALAWRGEALIVGTLGRGLLRFERGALREELHAGARPYFAFALAGFDRELLAGVDTSAAGPGLVAFAAAGPRGLPVASGPVAALLEDARGDLWAATRERGAFHLRAGRVLEHLTFEGTAGGLRSNALTSVFADAEGVLWFGSERGLSRYDPGSPQGERVSPLPQSNFVHALAATPDGRLWAGTQRGLFAREQAGGEWAPVPELQRRIVHALASDERGRLLVGSASALHVGQRDAQGLWSFRLLDPGEPAGFARSVRAVRAFQGRTYVASYGRGLERLDGDRRELLWPAPEADAPQRELLSLEVSGASLLIGTAHAGVWAWDGERAAALPGLAGLAGASVWSMAADTGGAVWLGTSQGLWRYAGGRAARVLEGHDVRAVLASDAPGRVFCASADAGLLQVGLDENGDALHARLDAQHGLPSNALYALVRLGDGLLAGTNRGLALYTPSRVPPRLRLTRVLGRRPYLPEEWQAGLRLAHPQNTLVLEAAAAASRTFPEEFQYQFTLRDAQGVLLKRKLARDGQLVADGLRPGAYVVSVRALSRDLVPSEPLRLAFEVEPAPWPWTTIALATLLAIALLALAWGLVQNRRLLQANVALLDTRLQLAQQTERERRRIARDLHDQTLFDLRRLLLMETPPHGPAFRETVEAISTEVRRICEDLSPSVLENVGLTAALEWALTDAVAHVPSEQACRAEFSCPDELEAQLSLDPGARIQVYRIVQEAVANACRHAGATTLALSLALEGGTFVATLADDGRGFDPRARAGAGRGLDNMRSRASLIDARVAWTFPPSGGTRFQVRVPGASGGAGASTG